MRQQSVIISLRKILYIITILFLLLILADLMVLMFKFGLGRDHVLGFVPLFDFDRERSIPVLFTTALFVYASFYMFILATLKEQVFRIRWRLLGLIFVFCAIDEFCSIHERFSYPMQQLFNTSGIFYFGWVIPYSIIGLLLLIFFLPLFASLSLEINRWLAGAFLVFFTGAVGIEMLGGYWYEQNGQTIDLIYSIFVFFEESFEMLGLLILLRGLHKYLNMKKTTLTLTL